MEFLGWIILAAFIGCVLGFLIADMGDSVDDVLEEGDDWNA